jgi:hypothetical protein
MKNLFLTVALTLNALVCFAEEPARLTTVSPNPFSTSLSVCYELPSDGTVHIKLVNVSDGLTYAVDDTNFKDKQGHGTHCGGLTVPASAPSGQYVVSLSFEGQTDAAIVTKQ